MGRSQSKTLPNWGEFLIGLGVYEEKKTAFLLEPVSLTKLVISTESFKLYQGKPVKQDSWWKVPREALINS